VKRGVYAKHFSGGQVNISNGDFRVLTHRELSDRGRQAHGAFTRVNLDWQRSEVLRQVTMVGHDFRLSEGTGPVAKDGQSVPVGVGPDGEDRAHHGGRHTHAMSRLPDARRCQEWAEQMLSYARRPERTLPKF